MSESVTIRDWTNHSAAWKAAVSYAYEQTLKKWREENNFGDVTPEFLKDWMTYYLAQQWNYRMPTGGLYSAMATP